MTILPENIPWGFRGDPFLLATVDALIHTLDIDSFVETGAFSGETVHYMATTYRLPCYSCEPDNERVCIAQERVRTCAQTVITQEESPTLLRRLATTLAGQRILFWLDAHGYGFDWPLREELAIITATWPTAVVLIDDFRVPGRDWFGFDVYDGQICEVDYVHDLIAPYSYRLWYPTYPATSVTTWPCRGWGLLLFGSTGMWRAPAWLGAAERSMV
ncbi:MAG: hypothetical protein HC828_01825 [Blastochloris sp.]|nr:hypothetical protein [Blastochloris sp.]